jgi:hypothetical protein
VAICSGLRGDFLRLFAGGDESGRVGLEYARDGRYGHKSKQAQTGGGWSGRRRQSSEAGRHGRVIGHG